MANGFFGFPKKIVAGPGRMKNHNHVKVSSIFPSMATRVEHGCPRRISAAYPSSSVDRSTPCRLKIHCQYRRAGSDSGKGCGNIGYVLKSNKRSSSQALKTRCIAYTRNVRIRRTPGHEGSQVLCTVVRKVSGRCKLLIDYIRGNGNSSRRRGYLDRVEHSLRHGKCRGP